MAHGLAAIAHIGSGKPASTEAESVGYAVGLLTWVLAGGVFVAAKQAAGDLTPWVLVWTRVILAASILWIFEWRHFAEMRHFMAEHGVRALIIGALGLGLPQGLLFLALNYTTAVNTVIIFAAAPMITLVGARIFLREELGALQLIGVIIAFGGTVLVAVKGSLSDLIHFQFSTGEMIALAAAALFSVYTMSIKSAHFELPRMPLLAILLTGAVIVTTPFACWELVSGDNEKFGWSEILILGYIAIPGGVFLYFLYNWSVDVLGAGRAGTLMYSQMIFATFFAWLLLSEKVHWYNWVGGGLILGGVVVVQLLKPKHAKAAS